jgi:hypothetical protein
VQKRNEERKECEEKEKKRKDVKEINISKLWKSDLSTYI